MDPPTPPRAEATSPSIVVRRAVEIVSRSFLGLQTSPVRDESRRNSVAEDARNAAGFSRVEEISGLSPSQPARLPNLLG